VKIALLVRFFDVPVMEDNTKWDRSVDRGCTRVARA